MLQFAFLGFGCWGLSLAWMPLGVIVGGFGMFAILEVRNR